MKKISKPAGLLVIIYVAFISIGLPDGILGVAWPSIRNSMGLPLEMVSILTTLLLFLSAFSSVASTRVLAKFGTGGVTFASGLMTGTALLGYSLSGNFIWLVVMTVPLGLGQGAVDSALNLYVAEHYSSRHMNWLHCFWGVGASLGPLIMTSILTGTSSWRIGYGAISGIQIVLSGVLLLSLVKKLWDVRHKETVQESGQQGEEAVPRLKKVSMQVMAVFLFFLYSGTEFSVGLWLNSVLIESRGISISFSGMTVSAYYASIMVGRFLSGMVVNRFGNVKMIRTGILLAVLGSLCVWVSPALPGVLAGVIMIGLGLAPIYPCLMHETPTRFEKKVSDRLIGYQVGAACLGGTVLSSATGIVLSNISLNLLFPLLALFLSTAFAVNEVLHRKKERLRETVEQTNEGKI